MDKKKSFDKKITDLRNKYLKSFKIDLCGIADDIPRKQRRQLSEYFSSLLPATVTDIKQIVLQHDKDPEKSYEDDYQIFHEKLEEIFEMDEEEFEDSHDFCFDDYITLIIDIFGKYLEKANKLIK